jgi:hypothetical protein
MPAPTTAAERLVARVLGEPDNYFIHRDTFLATVERAIREEREACAAMFDGRKGYMDYDMIAESIRNRKD